MHVTLLICTIFILVLIIFLTKRLLDTKQKEEKEEELDFDKLRTALMSIDKNKVNYKLLGKQVKVKTIDNTEIIGIFEENFEEEQAISVNKVLIKYNEIKEMKELSKKKKR